MIGAVWSLRWGNPYTSPPDGRGVIKELYFPLGHRHLRVCPPEILKAHVPGSGYGIYWSAVSAIPKKLPQDKLASVRQKRLRRRMEEKYPLFAEQFIDEEMQKRPEFYAGLPNEHLEQARDAVETLERLRLVCLIAEFEDRENLIDQVSRG